MNIWNYIWLEKAHIFQFKIWLLSILINIKMFSLKYSINSIVSLIIENTSLQINWNNFLKWLVKNRFSMGCNHEESWNDSSTGLNPVPSDIQHRVLSVAWNSTGILSDFYFEFQRNTQATHSLKTEKWSKGCHIYYKKNCKWCINYSNFTTIRRTLLTKIFPQTRKCTL